VFQSDWPRCDEHGASRIQSTVLKSHTSNVVHSLILSITLLLVVLLACSSLIGYTKTTHAVFNVGLLDILAHARRITMIKEIACLLVRLHLAANDYSLILMNLKFPQDASSSTANSPNPRLLLSLHSSFTPNTALQ